MRISRLSYLYVVFFFLSITLFGLWWRGSELFVARSTDESNRILVYMKESSNDEVKLKQFQKDFRDALKKPDRMEWIGKVYTDGLMNHIGYTELDPGFVAFADLHQRLYRAMHGRDPRFVGIPANLAKLFSEKSQKFIVQITKPEKLKDIESYYRKLCIG